MLNLGLETAHSATLRPLSLSSPDFLLPGCIGLILCSSLLASPLIQPANADSWSTQASRRFSLRVFFFFFPPSSSLTSASNMACLTKRYHSSFYP